MHKIMQYEGDEQLYMEYVGCPRLDHACSRHVSGLILFFNNLWNHRLRREGFMKDSHVGQVHWDTDAESGSFLGENKGRMATQYEVRNNKTDEIPFDDKDHPGCLYMSDTQWFHINIPLAKNITRPDGRLSIKWFSLDCALRDADSQFRTVMHRLMRMREIAEVNHGTLTATAHAYNYSREIQVKVSITYEAHIYDISSQEPCPYHVGEPAGEIEDGEEELHEDSAPRLTW